MRVPSSIRLALVLTLLAGAVPEIAAQDKLPAKMSGKWNGVTQRGTPFGGNWSVVIDSQNPDGSIEGKATWGGGQLCAMNSEPFTGKFDGTQLTIVAQFRDMSPNAGCQKASLVLKKSGNDFEAPFPARSSTTG
jgi:hypothetical protein